jgi:predicted anti-sigma-YlaC factor YlaD
MKHRHVIKRYLDWRENRVDDEVRLEIESHLADCVDCRRYFDKMTELMEGIGPDALPHLEPDPFLPARIRARADAGAPGPAPLPRPAFGRLAASLLGVAVVAAAVAGTLIGSGLSSRAIASEETQAIVSGYYEAFSQDEFAQQWETVLEPEEEDES